MTRDFDVCFETTKGYLTIVLKQTPCFVIGVIFVYPKSKNAYLPQNIAIRS